MISEDLMSDRIRVAAHAIEPLPYELEYSCSALLQEQRPQKHDRLQYIHAIPLEHLPGSVESQTGCPHSERDRVHQHQ